MNTSAITNRARYLARLKTCLSKLFNGVPMSDADWSWPLGVLVIFAIVVAAGMWVMRCS